MQYLIKLDLSNNNIVRLLDFEPHPYNLQEIDFSRNKIEVIDNLSNNRFLKKICLDSKYKNKFYFNKIKIKIKRKKKKKIVFENA